MHRHGYKGRKFGRETDQRTSLIKSLAESLIQYQSVETTLPKAKELISYTEKLITKAKSGNLHERRQIISHLHTVASAHKLVDAIAPQLTKRTSGHLRLEKTILRRGDNAQLARVSFVDSLKESAPPAKSSKRPASKKAPAAKRTTKRPGPKSTTPQPDKQRFNEPKTGPKPAPGGGRPSVRHTRSGER